MSDQKASYVSDVVSSFHPAKEKLQEQWTPGCDIPETRQEA